MKLIIQIIGSGVGEGDDSDDDDSDDDDSDDDDSDDDDDGEDDGEGDEGANTTAQQSGGANNNVASSMSVSELKDIDINKLQKGLKDCANREKLKKSFEDKQAEGPTEEEANYGEESTDDGAPLSAKPWFLYVVLGVLAFTTTIELGIFDAPQCLTHTFI